MKTAYRFKINCWKSSFFQTSHDSSTLSVNQLPLSSSLKDWIITQQQFSKDQQTLTTSLLTGRTYKTSAEKMTNKEKVQPTFPQSLEMFQYFYAVHNDHNENNGTLNI